jgi:hypothetical protein
MLEALGLEGAAIEHAIGAIDLGNHAVGKDGRNRTILSAFRSRTGRNQPSNTKYIFGPSVWLRGLIKPPPGHGVAYIDWSQQEFGIAAALSGDPAMAAAYRSGEPYLTFGKQAGAIPADATKATHKAPRELFKQCVLAVQYGMEAESLALRIGQPTIVARDLLAAHHETYRQFWRCRMPPWSRPCSPAHCIRSMAGISILASGPIRDRCAISPCRPMAPKCCGWRAASLPNAASKCVRQCTMPC